MRRHVLRVLTIGCVLASQVVSGGDWTVLNPPNGTYRTKGSCVIGNGNGPNGTSAKFKFGTNIIAPNETVILVGENEITVTSTGMMAGMPVGGWRTDPDSMTANQLAAPASGWNVSPTMPGQPQGMRKPDHIAGVVFTPAGLFSREETVATTGQHTVTP